MARATDADINILMDSVSIGYAAFIATANLIVNEDLAGSGFTEARLTQIEMYLAAHFAVLAKEKGGLVRTVAGESSETYHDPNSRFMGYTSTRFGQHAIALDTTGVLASQGSGGMKAQFRVV